MRRQDCERLLVDAGQDVADAEASTREADDLVEAIAGFVDTEREALDERVVLVPADVQVRHAIPQASLRLNETDDASRGSRCDPVRSTPSRSELRLASRSGADRRAHSAATGRKLSLQRCSPA